MSDTVIKVENISKQYRLGNVGLGTLSHDLNRWWYNVRGKEDPYLKIGEENNRSVKGESEYVWALRDINFEVKQSEVLGIIGRNGAGKSTLLKILSRTTTPTTGQIKIKGRVASLLEVGTGFHPELTGRENIFLNGAILGMTKKEIKSKFDEIVDFAGVERYIDTPVKRYSSGMYVRLAFGVAAHLEPEILIVDEVLAVGDAEFQKKALGKMKEVSEGQGRTVLFVSHNMAAVKNLCNSGLVLENGVMAFVSNDISDVITFYNSEKSEKIIIPLEYRKDREGNGEIMVTGLILFDNKSNAVSNAISGEYLKIHILYKVNVPQEEIDVGISFWSQSEDCKIAIWSSYTNSQYKKISRDGSFIIHFDNFPLSNGMYFLNIIIRSKDGSLLDWVKNAAIIKVEDGDFYNSGKGILDRLNSVLVPHRWSF